MTSRRFPPPWTVEQMPGGFKVVDANGQALVDAVARETRSTTPSSASLIKKARLVFRQLL